MVSRYEGFRALGKSSTATMVPARISTRSKSSGVIFPMLCRLLREAKQSSVCQPGQDCSTRSRNTLGSMPRMVLVLCCLLALAAPAFSFPLTVTDALGRRVVVPRAPSRIVSVAPSVTEVLFTLGLGARVVGVSSADDYPEAELREKPRVGGVVLDVERIVRLRPDLVLGMPSLQRAQLDRLIASGLPVVAVDARTLSEVYEQIRFIGRLTGTETEAARLVTLLRFREATVQRAINGRVAPRTYIEIWAEPLITAGGDTFIDDLVRRAGGRNVFARLRGFPQVSAESVIRADPAGVILTH